MQKKVGHAGTLDPLATGLLILCTGKMTRQIEQFQQMPKEYTGTFFLGATTPSFDLETKVDNTFPTGHITEEKLRDAVMKFKGTILQVPPLHSAVMVKGERAYEKARRGEKAELQPKEIIIYDFEITAIRLPEIDFRVLCSKGTYIRSLARDVGRELESGAYLQSLCRTMIGEYKLSDAMELEEFTSLLKKAKQENQPAEEEAKDVK